MKTKLMGLMFAVAFCCGSAQAAVIDLSAAENNQTIKTAVGDIVRIRLKGNATTGYSWQFQITDIAVAGKVAEGYIPDNAPVGLVGSSGTFEYILKMLKDGQVTVIGYYYRPWEKPDKDKTEKVEYFIKVQK